MVYQTKEAGLRVSACRLGYGADEESRGIPRACANQRSRSEQTTSAIPSAGDWNQTQDDQMEKLAFYH